VSGNDLAAYLTLLGGTPSIDETINGKCDNMVGPGGYCRDFDILKTR
jgi:hypothetical protein